MPLDNKILEPYKGNVFIETGTQVGNGVVTSLALGFKKVYSIELKDEYFENCSKMFNSNDRVILIHGDSSVEFPKLLETIEEPVTFWLDAHSPQGTSLMSEIRAIKEHPIKTHTILIDDIRLFKRHYWKVIPEFDEIIEEIKEINADYDITLIDSTHFENDILVAQIKT